MSLPMWYHFPNSHSETEVTEEVLSFDSAIHVFLSLLGIGVYSLLSMRIQLYRYHISFNSYGIYCINLVDLTRGQSPAAYCDV